MKEIKDQNKQYLIEKLRVQGKRLDGRGLFEERNFFFEYNAFSKNLFSGFANLGKTKVLVSFDFEFGKPYSNLPSEGAMSTSFTYSLYMPSLFVEKKKFIDKEVELSRVIDRCIRHSKIIDFKALCLEAGEKAVFLYFDFVCLYDDGNLIDCSIKGVNHILRELSIKEFLKKKLALEEEEFINNNFEFFFKKKSLIPAFFVKYENYFLRDPTKLEELDSSFTISFAFSNKKICSIQKSGIKGIQEKDLLELVKPFTE